MKKPQAEAWGAHRVVPGGRIGPVRICRRQRQSEHGDYSQFTTQMRINNGVAPKRQSRASRFCWLPFLIGCLIAAGCHRDEGAHELMSAVPESPLLAPPPPPPPVRKLAPVVGPTPAPQYWRKFTVEYPPEPDPAEIAEQRRVEAAAMVEQAGGDGALEPPPPLVFEHEPRPDCASQAADEAAYVSCLRASVLYDQTRTSRAYRQLHDLLGDDQASALEAEEQQWDQDTAQRCNAFRSGYDDAGMDERGRLYCYGIAFGGRSAELESRIVLELRTNR